MSSVQSPAGHAFESVTLQMRRPLVISQPTAILLLETDTSSTRNSSGRPAHIATSFVRPVDPSLQKKLTDKGAQATAVKTCPCISTDAAGFFGSLVNMIARAKASLVTVVS